MTVNEDATAQQSSLDLDRVRAAVERQADRMTEGIDDMVRYLAAQVADESHREVTGPLLTGSGPSGVIRHRGEVVATWGDPTTAPGTGWAYNDVRVNLLCLALTLLFRRPLGEVLREAVLDPLGASSSWSWHGYVDSVVEIDGVRVPVVSGGAHWGGGLWISAADLALLGELYRDSGRWQSRRRLSDEWIRRAWAPCALNPDYGYLWWRNDSGRVQPGAPGTGRCARGNGGRHLLWVDPDRDLVIASHWGDRVAELITEVSAAVPATAGR